MMRSEYFDFYLWLKRYYLEEWVTVKSRQPRECITFYEWEDNKYLYALRSFNEAASLEFSKMFDDVMIPLNVDRWGLNTAYFESDDQCFDYVKSLQARLGVILERERRLIK